MVTFNIPKIVGSIHLFLFLQSCHGFFFSKNATEYNELVDPVPQITTVQVTSTLSPLSSANNAESPTSSTSTSLSVEEKNSTNNTNSELEEETQQNEEESQTTSTTVDSSAAFYTKAYTIAPRISAPLSMFGSILILIEVLRKKRKDRKSYHRILLGMSCVDLYTSFWYIFSSYPVKGGVVTNQALCSAQGWGLQMGLTIPIYNTMLAFFYMLVIRYRWNHDRLQKVELLFHIIPLSLGLGTSLAGLGLKLYNNANIWCWIASYPSTCKSSFENNGVTDCIRGNNADIYRLAFFYGPLFCSIILSIILTVLTIQYIASVEKKSAKYAMKRVKNKNNTNTYSKLVAIQSFCYIGVYFITWTPLSAVRCIQFAGKTAPRWLLLLGTFFTPFQGFMNCFVYFRPRFLEYRNKYPEMSFCSFLSLFFRRGVAHVLGDSSRSVTSDHRGRIGV